MGIDAGMSSLVSDTGKTRHIILNIIGAVMFRRDRQALNGGGRLHKCGERS